MAKYQINYNCGHTGTVNLYGKHNDRHRKIDWLTSQNCPRCTQKERGLEARVILSANMVEIQFVGDTYPHKDKIKSLGGYRFSRDLTTGHFDLNAETGWVKAANIKDIDEILSAIDDIKNAGLPVPNLDNINTLDIITTQAAIKG